MRKSLSLIFSLLVFLTAYPQSLVLLHTNDTHSHIDADESGFGGVLQRKAIIDSVRRAEKNVLLIDAGDIVQGTLFYKLFGGAVEFPLMKLMGYDMQILGNHEFDNGMEALAFTLDANDVPKLASNYNFADPQMQRRFLPWLIKTVDGKRIGFMGLNLNPEGIISEDNARGVIFHDIVQSADSTAALLRSKGCKTVVAVTHIGYTDDTGRDLLTDPELARLSRGIDLIIGGHSHTMVGPDGKSPYIVDNAEGRPVMIVQTGRYGTHLGYVKLNVSDPRPQSMTARLIPVAGIDSARFDPAITAFLRPFRKRVDEANAEVIAWCGLDMVNSKKYALSTPLGNWAAQCALEAVRPLLHEEIDDSEEMAILSLVNCGGIRLPFPKGEVTRGQVLSAFPFSNHLVVARIPPSKLPHILEEARTQGGMAVGGGWRVAFDSDGRFAGMTQFGATLSHQNQEPGEDSSVLLVTIDYLAGGGDYMSALKGCEVVWRDPLEFGERMLRAVRSYGEQRVPILPSSLPWIVEATPAIPIPSPHE